MKTITIRLTSPLQSYGNQAQFTRRTTSDYPSKSAVVGMLAAALGYHRDDTRIASLNDLALAVRIDQPGTVMTEFQTVEWKKGTRKLTYRELLEDAVFLVAIGVRDDAFADLLVDALRHPVFQLYLGRRANVPAGVLAIAEFSDSDPITVLTTSDWQASTWFQRKHSRQQFVDLEVIADSSLLNNRPVTFAKDKMLSFSQRDRRFDYRAVSQIRVHLANPVFKAHSADTGHNIMDAL